MFVGLVLGVALGELALRLQQRLGPYYDLEFVYAHASQESDIVNHKPLAEEMSILPDGSSFHLRFRDNGLRINSQRPPCEEGRPRFRILFMGDSTMLGYDDEHTIPQAVWRFLEARDQTRCFDVLNAAYASYSPAIYVAQARWLLPELKPDAVVVEIDETDLLDDYLRYRSLVIRDDAGRNIGVQRGPLIMARNQGFSTIREYPLYSLRLPLAFYHTKIRMPRLTQRHRERTGLAGHRRILAISRQPGPGAAARHREEIRFFEDNLDELGIVLSEFAGREQILFLHHPHYLHLESGLDGQRYNDIVSSTIERVCRRHGLRFFAPRDELARAFDGRPGRYYFWPEDPYSHFTPEGLMIYGGLVARKVLALVH